MLSFKTDPSHPSLLPPDFTEGSVFNSLTQYNGGALINKDTPEDSRILVKATDGHSSNDISNGQKDAILSWIANGANNNQNANTLFHEFQSLRIL